MRVLKAFLWNTVSKISLPGSFISPGSFKVLLTQLYSSLVNPVFDVDMLCTWSLSRTCPCHSNLITQILLLTYSPLFNYILSFLGRRLAWGFASSSRLSFSPYDHFCKFVSNKVDKNQISTKSLLYILKQFTSRTFTKMLFKDGASFCYCAYVQRISSVVRDTQVS